MTTNTNTTTSTTDTNTTDALTTAIATLADTIAPLVQAHAESEAAQADELAAQTALVTRILEIARPSVRALGTRPQISDEFISGGGQVDTKRAPWRGIVLSCEPRQIGPERKGRTHDSNEGAYSGSDVFLREDGALVRLNYSGAWSNWQNATCSWEATEDVLTVEDFCARWEASEPAELIAHLLKLAQSAGDRGKVTAAARERAAKYRALAALL